VALILAACRGATEPITPAATHPAGVIASTLALAGRPHGVAVASDGRFCVSQIDAAMVSCGQLSAADATLGRGVPVGPAPAHVALSPNGGEAYTADQYGNSLSVVDVAAARSVGTVALTDGGFNVLADPGGARVYVTTASGILHVVDVGTRQVVARVPVGAAANGLALDRAAGRLYVSSLRVGTVTAVNTTTNTVARTYQVSAMPQRIALAAGGTTLYVASESTGLEVLDLATGARAAVAGVAPGAVGLALSPDGARLYVTNPPGGSVHIVDVARRQVTATLAGLASPRNVAFGLAGAAALVTGEGGAVYVVR
jgi:YVTN family beta-propeller protein